MIISFDLDDTLIPGTKTFETEKRSLFQKFCGIERIRVGTIQLMKTCKGKGHKVYIYTTSLRTPGKIWWMFFTYGFQPDKIINQRIHEEMQKHHKVRSSKYPPAFKIDIHIDDSKGVGMEGEWYDFRTIIIGEDNVNWTDDILKQIT